MAPGSSRLLVPLNQALKLESALLSALAELGYLTIALEKNALTLILIYLQILNFCTTMNFKFTAVEVNKRKEKNCFSLKNSISFHKYISHYFDQRLKNSYFLNLL